MSRMSELSTDYPLHVHELAEAEANTGRLKAALIEASDALTELQERASSFSVSGVYFDEACFKENVAALKRASEAEDAAEAAIDKAGGRP